MIFCFSNLKYYFSFLGVDTAALADRIQAIEDADFQTQFDNLPDTAAIQADVTAHCEKFKEFTGIMGTPDGTAGSDAILNAFLNIADPNTC